MRTAVEIYLNKRDLNKPTKKNKSDYDFFVRILLNIKKVGSQNVFITCSHNIFLISLVFSLFANRTDNFTMIT